MSGENQNQDVLGSLFSGRYTLDRILGKGGLGTVYAATDVETGIKVAVKVPSPGEHIDYAVARFASEANYHRAVHHPNIVEVLDVGTDDIGHPYMVLEFVDGISLSDLIKKRAPLPLPEVLDILLQICDALEAVHTARLVHRDLKAANIMILEHGDDTRTVKLLDFGIVKAIDDAETLTAPSSFVGTPHYISPEEIQNATIDGRADLYAMGVLLYRMATRRFPYRGKPVQVLHATLHHKPASFRRVAPNLRLPIELQRIALRCLEKSPSNRYDTAGSLAKDLRVLLAVETQANLHEIGTLKPQKTAQVTPVPALTTHYEADEEYTEPSGVRVLPPRQRVHVGAVLAAVIALIAFGTGILWFQDAETNMPVAPTAPAVIARADKVEDPVQAHVVKEQPIEEGVPQTTAPRIETPKAPVVAPKPKPKPIVAKAKPTPPAPLSTPDVVQAGSSSSKVIVSAAARSMVTIEGQDVGHTPVTINAGVGTYSISVTAPDQPAAPIRRVAVDGSGDDVNVHFD